MINLTIQQILRDPDYALDAQIEVEILLAFVLQQSRTYLYTHSEAIINQSHWEHFKQLITQRRAGTPIAYLIAEREFWSLPLKVTPATLIPRPETELLVEITLSLLGSLQEATILDLGTGAGGIALALAKEKPQWKIYATDFNPDTLAVAQDNAARLQLHSITFYQSDWFSAIPPGLRFHGIISNPPYIAYDDPHIQQGDLRFEPMQALCSDEHGLADLRKIIEQSLARLEKNGLLLLEHGYDQKIALIELLKKNHYQSIQSWVDYQGLARIIGARQIAFDE